MLKIYDSFLRKKCLFQPINEQHIRLYVCGPTVYDRAHIGNARPVVVFDVLTNLLRLLYPKVTYARNITDIDDKIINKAKERGISIESLTKETIRFYHEDMAALKATPPDFEPRATENINNMIFIINQLIEKGHAYHVKNHVLFQVSTYKDYGKLSGRTLDEMIAGARVEVAPYKKSPEDFILWKPSTDDQPGWESPWGRGRPGWHLECSAMTQALLGTSLDIHGGGCELAFPHHENERAQSMCAFPDGIFAKYWMHNGLLTIDGEKMSKSLGNFLTVNNLLDKYPGEAMRLALLSGHYRQPLDWTSDLLSQSIKSLNTFYGALRLCPEVSNISSENLIKHACKKVWEALLDDLNTPLALSHMHTLAADVHKERDEIERVEKSKKLKASGSLMGLLTSAPEDWFKKGGDISSRVAENIEKLIANREKARLEKNFSLADSIRKQLLEMNIALEDSSKGTTWRYLNLSKKQEK